MIEITLYTYVQRNREQVQRNYKFVLKGYTKIFFLTNELDQAIIHIKISTVFNFSVFKLKLK